MKSKRDLAAESCANVWWLRKDSLNWRAEGPEFYLDVKPRTFPKGSSTVLRTLVGRFQKTARNRLQDNQHDTDLRKASVVYASIWRQPLRPIFSLIQCICFSMQNASHYSDFQLVTTWAPIRQSYNAGWIGECTSRRRYYACTSLCRRSKSFEDRKAVQNRNRGHKGVLVNEEGYLAQQKQ